MWRAVSRLRITLSAKWKPRAKYTLNQSTILIFILWPLTYYPTSCCDLFLSRSSSLLTASSRLLSSSSFLCRASSRNFIRFLLASDRASILIRNLGGLGTRSGAVRDLSLSSIRGGKRESKTRKRSKTWRNSRLFNLISRGKETDSNTRIYSSLRNIHATCRNISMRSERCTINRSF